MLNDALHSCSSNDVERGRTERRTLGKTQNTSEPGLKQGFANSCGHASVSRDRRQVRRRHIIESVGVRNMKICDTHHGADDDTRSWRHCDRGNRARGHGDSLLHIRDDVR
eukprot:Amastigsp_a508389_369.p5 type:complete len:110 gc:universal Amastigsp_a508389_369:699-370(-)